MDTSLREALQPVVAARVLQAVKGIAVLVVRTKARLVVVQLAADLISELMKTKSPKMVITAIPLVIMVAMVIIAALVRYYVIFNVVGRMPVPVMTVVKVVRIHPKLKTY